MRKEGVIKKILEGEKLLQIAEEMEEKAMKIRMEGDAIIAEARNVCKHPNPDQKPFCEECRLRPKKKCGKADCRMQNAFICDTCKTVVCF